MEKVRPDNAVIIFKTQWNGIEFPIEKPSWDHEPVEGFQDHACESIPQLLNRLANGDTTVFHQAIEQDRDSFFEDSFDTIDAAESNLFSRENNSVSLDSGGQAAPGQSQAANNPGDTEIASSEIGETFVENVSTGDEAVRNPELKKK